MTGTSSHLNAEMANFFRCHTKNTKLTNEESYFIDNLLFSRSSPTKKTIPLFPRATPVCKETPFINSKYSSLSSTGLKSSRKRLEIFDKDLESFKPSFLLSEEIPVPSDIMDRIRNIVTDKFDETGKIKSFNDSNEHNPAENDNIRSPPRQMTDAAKELMASINMNVYNAFPVPEPIEISSNIPKQNENIPSFEFKIPKSSLPEFYFDISPEKISKSVEKQPEFEFHFDISGYVPGSSTHVSDSQLPKFHFKID